MSSSTRATWRRCSSRNSRSYAPTTLRSRAFCKFLPFQAMMDRERKDELPQMQVGFIDVICLPLYRVLSETFPWVKPLYQGTLENRKNWQDLAEKVEMGLTWIDHDTIDKPVEAFAGRSPAPEGAPRSGPPFTIPTTLSSKTLSTTSIKNTANHFQNKAIIQKNILHGILNIFSIPRNATRHFKNTIGVPPSRKFNCR
jgi:hypothetical protein